MSTWFSSINMAWVYMVNEIRHSWSFIPIPSRDKLNTEKLKIKYWKHGPVFISLTHPDS